MQFTNIKSIKEFQLFRDSTGYLLSDNATLYAFEGSQTKLIPTPNEFIINDFYFKNDSCGVIIGNSIPQTLKSHAIILESGVKGILFPLLLSIILSFFLRKNKIGKYTAITLVFMVSACSIFWKSEKVNISANTSEIHFNSKRQVIKNKGINTHALLGYPTDQIYSFIASTNNYGKTWNVTKICNQENFCSNFLMTDITYDGTNYIIGTYGPNGHADGDIYTINKNETNTIGISRGIRGVQYISEFDKPLIVYFGSDKMVKIPGHEFSKTKGGIVFVSSVQDSIYRFVKSPEINTDVNSLGILNKEHFYATTTSGKLFEFKNQNWRQELVKDSLKVKMITSNSSKNEIYAITETNECYRKEIGSNWKLLPYKNVSSVKNKNKEIYLVIQNRIQKIN